MISVHNIEEVSFGHASKLMLRARVSDLEDSKLSDRSVSDLTFCKKL